VARIEARGKIGVSDTPPSATSGSILIRPCTSLAELRACVALQKEIWNFSDAELVPLRIFVVATKIGGHVIGAFARSADDNNALIGYALALPGIRNGHAFLYSQMLAIHAQYRNAGIGRRIKLAQRDEAISAGIDLMEWTFDPLEIKNSYLNIEKLGAIVRRYNVDQYGITSSPLQGGLPTDRLIAEWWLKSKRVSSVLAAQPKPNFEILTRINVPAEIYQWKSSAATRDRALKVQDANRPLFQQAFASGQTVLGFERNERGDGEFLLGKWDEKLTLRE
jgi:predicted GNAT superfamily acetyltransferase